MNQHLQDVIHVLHLCDLCYCLGGRGAQYEIKCRPTLNFLGTMQQISNLRNIIANIFVDLQRQFTD